MDSNYIFIVEKIHGSHECKVIFFLKSKKGVPFKLR